MSFITEIDALALGAGHLEDGVIENEHGNKRETECDDEQDDRIRQRRRPAQETSSVRCLVVVPVAFN